MQDFFLLRLATTFFCKVVSSAELPAGYLSKSAIVRPNFRKQTIQFLSKGSKVNMTKLYLLQYNETIVILFKSGNCFSVINTILLDVNLNIEVSSTGFRKSSYFTSFYLSLTIFRSLKGG
jgi:hypothetical protein